jgi:hypothetical protein
LKPKSPQSGGFNSTDSLVLLAISSYRDKAGASKAEIAEFCDMVDHRIITDEELSAAVGRLRAGEFIEKRNGRFYPARKSIEALLEDDRWTQQWESFSRLLRVKS